MNADDQLDFSFLFSLGAHDTVYMPLLILSIIRVGHPIQKPPPGHAQGLVSMVILKLLSQGHSTISSDHCVLGQWRLVVISDWVAVALPWPGPFKEKDYEESGQMWAWL